MYIHLRAEYDTARETHGGVLALADHVVCALEVGRGVDEGGVVLW